MRKKPSSKPHQPKSFLMNKKLVFLLLVMSVLEIFASTFFYIYFQRFLQTSMTSNSLDYLHLGLLLAILIVYLALEFFNVYLSSYLVFRGSAKAQYHYFLNLISQRPSEVNQMDLGKITNDFNSTVPYIGANADILMIVFAVSATNLIIFLGLCFYYSWIIGCIVTFVLGLVLFFNRILAAKISKINKEAVNQQNTFISYFLDSMKSLETIHFLNKGPYFNRQFNKVAWGKRGAINKQLDYLNAVYKIISIFMMVVFPLLLMGVGIALISSNLLLISTLVILIPICTQIQSPARQMGEIILERKQVLLLKTNYVKYLEALPSNNDQSIVKVSQMKIQNLNFAYEEKEIFKDLNLSFNTNDIIILKGASGEGKTTLLNLMANKIASPAIAFDQKTYENYLRSKQWPSVILVEQNNTLFNLSLRDNLRLGGNIDDEDLIQHLKLGCLDKFVEDYGLDLWMVNGGENISGGQKQRICLVRSLWVSPHFCC
ncbi:MAG: ABC transporter ATP-binding protein/permease [Acholeplasmatales bacterium]|jgi:ABC-type bacteriocin/lantibiotic exporter with double-glycine peptidase domain|nr:ABC transporter ATP-binding protein/permease [Acholeplasmatales bacterium]